MKRFAPLLVVVACGTTTATTDGGGTDGSATPSCPSSAPSEGAPCTPGSACEYGGNAMGQCATYALCGANDTWHLTPPPTGCGTNPMGCPASFAALAEGSACPLANGGTCYYPEGACTCRACAADGGGMAQMWTCRTWSSAGAGCPTPRPLLGTACSQDGLECAWSGCCSASLGKSEVCKNGFWQSVPGVGCLCDLPACK